MLRAFLIACAALLLTVPAAGASTVGKVGSTLVYTPSAGTAADDVVVVQDANNNPVNFIFVGSPRPTPGASCSNYDDAARSGVQCPAAGVTGIILNGGDGEDDLRGGEVSFSYFCFPFPNPCPAPPPTLFPVRVPLTVDAGPGNDSVIDGAGADTLNGGAGNDELSGVFGGSGEVIDGDSGDDVLTGAGGSDTLVGDDGRDRLSPGGGNDGINGGAGADEVSYASTAQPVNVSLDDAANDGRPDAGEQDNVHSDVESVRGGDGADVLTGNDGANELSGGPGSDTLTGGGGADSLFGEDGGATVQARDGTTDRIDCGGAGSAVSDDFDVVANCPAVQSSGELQADLDHDGSAAPADCNDANSTVHPGAADGPGNGIDEDCSGFDAATPPAAATPLQTIGAFVQSDFAPKGRSTLVTRLRVRQLKAGTTVKAFCKGGKKKGCPVAEKEQTVSADTATLDLRKLLRLKTLRSGVTVEVQLLRSDSLGRITTYRTRSGAVPKVATTCVRPGASTAQACP